MSIELVAVIITGVISAFDFVVNIATLCLGGHCRSSCCGCDFEHDKQNKQESERNENE